MKKPLVSIVIATYNMGHYLSETLRSVLAQTYDNFEVIIIDDGSTDDTAEKMNEFTANPKVRYLPQENKGQPKAKNAGLRACNGDFIAFCDADDLWTNDKLEKQIPIFDNPEVGIVYTEVSYIDHKGQSLEKTQSYPRFSGCITDKLILKNFIPFGTAVIRKECIKEIGMFDETLPMGIDWDLWLRYSLHYQFQYIPNITYIYRIWPGQMSSNYRGRYANVEKIMDKFLRNNPDVLEYNLVQTAWADSYANFAMAIAKSERTFFEPLSYLFKAIGYKMSYWPAWKNMVKLMIRRV